ncbi:MAG: flavin reductase family protein [Rhodospirillaceae bacterium]
MTDGGFDQREFRNALGRFATGVTVITTVGPGGKPEGMTANSFGGLSLDPALVHWCIGRTAPSHDIFAGADHFAINILRADQRLLSNQFATPAEDKFAGVDWRPGLGGCLLLAGALATFECRSHCRHPGGDHTILVGAVERFAYEDGPALLFNAGNYALAAAYPDDTAALEADKFANLLL